MFSRNFNNAEHVISRLSLRSILLIFCFKSVALFFSPSLFFYLSLYLALPLSIFSLICRDKAIRRVNTYLFEKSSRRPHSEFYRFVVSTRVSQRKHDIFGSNKILFFFYYFLQRARSIMYLALNLQDEVIVELPINQIDPLLRMKG